MIHNVLQEALGAVPTIGCEFDKVKPILIL
jgi:hypothetical protein